MLAKRWQEYYSQIQKEIALRLRSEDSVEYGDIIYQSPEIKSVRWLVMAFKDEYNVFVDKMTNSGGFDRKLGASFSWEGSALKFAQEMFLVCNGGLRRQDRYEMTIF